MLEILPFKFTEVEVIRLRALGDENGTKDIAAKMQPSKGSLPVHLILGELRSAFNSNDRW